MQLLPEELREMSNCTFSQVRNFCILTFMEKGNIEFLKKNDFIYAISLLLLRLHPFSKKCYICITLLLLGIDRQMTDTLSTAD